MALEPTVVDRRAACTDRGVREPECESAADAGGPDAAPPVPAGPPKPLEGATITITSSGFRLDPSSAALFDINDLHVLPGARLMFVNNDNDPHDVLSRPIRPSQRLPGNQRRRLSWCRDNPARPIRFTST